MTYLTRMAALAPIAALAFASPLAAQDKAGDKVNMVIAYDESECPEQTDENEIVVCTIVVEAERYRIPSNLRTSSSPDNEAWASRVESIRYIGAFGTYSCDPAGAGGGTTGCTEKFINEAFAERSQSENVRFAQLIEQARQERLSSIDTDAAAEQERVEQIEREYLERLERERDAALPGEAPLGTEDGRLGPPDLSDDDEADDGAEPGADDGAEEETPLR